MLAESDAAPWEATITPCRWGYDLTFRKGLIEMVRDIGWWRPTRRGAERCARRVIARENAKEAREARRWVVRRTDAEMDAETARWEIDKLHSQIGLPPVDWDGGP